ncbi:Fe-S cluster assembly ATPase SufC [candidate division KSB1 bacterium]|nr:Fe-S cluster assembly ATPase SufC [candidate division KSB1 bacterium]
MAEQMEFKIENLHANVEGKPILKGVNLTMRTGETHALMGPNGSGKSTLANVIMGHPKYEVTEGRILVNDINILDLEADERSHLGLFLAFQYPVEISGVTVTKFLKRALESKYAAASNGKRFQAKEFINELRENVEFLDLDMKFVNRYLNEGFSGGEKKRMEVLQMLMLKPKFAILDETDSGLDIDAIKVVSKGVNKLKGPDMGTVVITHYQRILNYVKPDYVHILYLGQVVTSGGPEMVTLLEEQGYDWVKEKYGELQAA